MNYMYTFELIKMVFKVQNEIEHHRRAFVEVFFRGGFDLNCFNIQVILGV